MGNVQSAPKHNLYIIKVSNKNLPLVPFIHTIVGYNNTQIKDTDPLVLSNILRSQDLVLDVFDILQNKKFKITVPRFSDPETGKLGINVTKLVSIPTPLNIKVTAVSESSNTDLRIGDNIIGIESLFLENEDELIYQIKTNTGCRLVVLREDKAVTLEIPGNKLGCEIGTGLIHKPMSKEYILDGYTGEIIRIEESSGTENKVEKQDYETKPIITGEPNNEPIDAKKPVITGESNNEPIDSKKPVNKPIIIGESNGESVDAKKPVNKPIIIGESNLNSIVTKNPNDESVNAIDSNSNSIVTEPTNNESVDIKNSNDDKMSLEALKSQIEQPTDEPHPLPQIPNKTRAVVNKDRTGSYIYKSPKPQDNVPLNIHSHNDNETFSEHNERKIYEEADLPTEKEFFQGQIHNKPETTTILNTDVVCKDDFIFKDGNQLMKDEVFEERKNNNQKISDIFEDDDDSLPFETKKDMNGQSI